jgi:nucleoside-diphosphate-sugar epimerase
MRDAKNVSILGCGWLGLPLAKSLLRKGHIVKGSRRSLEGAKLLEKEGIKGFVIELSEKLNSTLGKEAYDFFQCDSLVVSIPPGIRSGKETKEDFLEKISELIGLAQRSNRRLIFVSSTSVFGDYQGEVNEDSETRPESENGKALKEAEKLLLRGGLQEVAILRLGGLIGEDRQPGRFLAGKKNLKRPRAPVNLIHQRDAVGLLVALIEKKELSREIFHGVSPYHPTRKEFYEKAARELGLEKPVFENEAEQHRGVHSYSIQEFKEVSARQTCETLAYHFKNPSLGYSNRPS